MSHKNEPDIFQRGRKKSAIRRTVRPASDDWRKMPLFPAKYDSFIAGNLSVATKLFPAPRPHPEKRKKSEKKEKQGKSTIENSGEILYNTENI